MLYGMQGLGAQGITDYLDHLKSLFLQAEAGAAPPASQMTPDGTASAAEDAPAADLVSCISLISHCSMHLWLLGKLGLTYALKIVELWSVRLEI